MDYMVRNPLKLNLGHLGHVEMQCPKQQTTRTPHYPLLNVFRIWFFFCPGICLNLVLGRKRAIKICKRALFLIWQDLRILVSPVFELKVKDPVWHLTAYIHTNTKKNSLSLCTYFHFCYMPSSPVLPLQALLISSKEFYFSRLRLRCYIYICFCLLFSAAAYKGADRTL